MPKKIPEGLPYLIIIGFLERLAFWGVQSLLLVYILQTLPMGVDERLSLYAAFMILNYVAPLMGGWFADNFIGNQKGLRFGLLIQSFGLFVLLYKHPIAIYIGLGAIILGTGFLRVNIFSLLGKLYGKENPAIDVGFTSLYYLISVAGLLAPFITLKVAHMLDWNYACGFLGILLLTAFFPLEKARTSFGYHGVEPSLNTHLSRYVSYKAVKRFFYTSSLVMAPIFSYLLWKHNWIGTLLPLASIFVCFFIVYLSVVHKMYKIMFFYLVILIFNLCFIALFNQAAAFISLLTSQANTTNLESVFGRAASLLLFESFSVSKTSEFFNLLNACTLLMTGPLVVLVWQWINRRKKQALPTVKFALGFFFAAIGFAVLSQIHRFGLTMEGHLTFWWLLFSQFLLVAAELFIVPVALAQITRVVPYKYLGVLIGVWFLSLSGAQRLGNWFLGKMHIMPLQAHPDTLHALCDGFVTFGWWAFAFAILALFMSIVCHKCSAVTQR